MIRELQVRNLALIEDIVLEFTEGFSTFTGETGAGKSILIGAIGLLLGDRASTDMVRAGCTEAEVRGIFELSDKAAKALTQMLDDAGVSASDGTLIVRRVISTSGKNRAYLNDVPVTLATLSEAGKTLVDFHGQHEHQSLLDPKTAYEIIDGLPQVRGARAAYDEAFGILTRAQEELAQYEHRAAELAQRREFLEFQYNELSSMELREGEEENLERELALLSTAVQRASCVQEIRATIAEGDAPLLAQLAAVRKRLEQLAKFDPSTAAWIDDFAGAVAVVNELERFCASYAQRLHGDSPDPSRIDELNSRLAKIQRLKKKYGCSLSELIVKKEALKADLDALANASVDRASRQERVAAAAAACREGAVALSRARAEAAAAFDRKVSANMALLGFTSGAWRTTFTPQAQLRPHGMESVAFFVRTNQGEPFLPLHEVASGGELSRLMLAVKCVLAVHDRIPVLIFDEIDSGIGGITAREVGKALKSLSATHQVICITHLHQIASMADNHYLVYKEVKEHRTVTRVKWLSQAEKVAELARMLGGESDIALRHARQLLRHKRQ